MFIVVFTLNNLAAVSLKKCILIPELCCVKQKGEKLGQLKWANYLPQWWVELDDLVGWLFTNRLSATRYMKVKRMGITEIWKGFGYFLQIR